MKRRRLLAGVGLLAVPAAGCTDDADAGAGSDDGTTTYELGDLIPETISPDHLGVEQ